MKKFKQIALSAFLTVSAFGAVLYTSCNPDECKDVVCQNGGTCNAGTCTCPTGVGGDKCETIYRTTYVNTYKGNGSDNEGDTYTDWRATFSTVGTDLTKMEFALKSNTGATIVTLPVTLSDMKSTGSVFTITSTTIGTETYTGTGTISSSVCSITLTEKSGSSTLVFTFTNMAKL